MWSRVANWPVSTWTFDATLVEAAAPGGSCTYKITALRSRSPTTPIGPRSGQRSESQRMLPRVTPRWSMATCSRAMFPSARSCDSCEIDLTQSVLFSLGCRRILRGWAETRRPGNTSPSSSSATMARCSASTTEPLFSDRPLAAPPFGCAGGTIPRVEPRNRSSSVSTNRSARQLHWCPIRLTYRHLSI